MSLSAQARENYLGEAKDDITTPSNNRKKRKSWFDNTIPKLINENNNSLFFN